MKRKLFYAFAALATLFALVSCDQNEKVEAEEVIPDEVLFSLAGNGDGFFIVETSATEPVKVLLIRPDGGDEATYQIASNSSDALNVPSSVSFGIGQTKATIEIGLPANMEPKTRYDISIALTGKNVAESVSELGSIRYEASIYTYEEVKMRTCLTSDLGSYNEDTGLYSDMLYNHLGYFKSTFWILPDNMIIWKDVLSTGCDIRFTCDSNKDSYNYYPVIDIRIPTGLDPLYDDPSIEDDDEDYLWYYFGEYEDPADYDSFVAKKFYPKGKERYIDRLDIAYGPENSVSAWNGRFFYLYSYLEFDDNNKYGYLLFEKVDTWDDGTNYVDYPEIIVPDYPEAAEATPQQGNIPLTCYMYETKSSSIYLDSQEGKLSTDSEGHPVLTIENFLNSGTTAVFTQKNENKEMEINIVDGYVYNYGGTDYYYDENLYNPWQSDENWQFGDFCFVYSAKYCTAQISDSYVRVRLGCYFDLLYKGVQVKDDSWGYLTLLYEAK